jgi:hypothetical protein
VYQGGTTSIMPNTSGVYLGACCCRIELLYAVGRDCLTDVYCGAMLNILSHICM